MTHFWYKYVVFIQGYKVPARTEIMIIADLIQRNKKWFPNPNKFDPERWNLAEGEMKQHPYAYIPFSAGSRKVSLQEQN